MFSVTTKTHTFQNAFVCTRPYFISDKVIAMNIKRMRVHFLSDSLAGTPSADLKVPRISLDAQTQVLELAWWITRLLDEAQAYQGHGQERGTTELLSKEVRSATWVDCLVRSIGKINRNILSGAPQLFSFMLRIVHYGRSTIACSQTLCFLFRDFRVRVWKKTRRGIHWTKVQVGGDGEKRK